jgi:predicted porin
MNKLLLLLPALILSIPAMAQTAAAQGSGHPATATFSRWSLSMETGPSFPVGNFHDKTFYSTSAGFARTGVGAELAATYHFCPSFGLALSAGFQDNPTTATAPYLNEDPGPFNQENTVIQRQSWKIGRLLAGAVYGHTLSKNKRLALRIRALAGVVKTEIPGFRSLTVDGQTGTETVGVAWKYSHLSPGFAYQTDAGFKYAITKRISVLVNAGYTGSRFTGRFSNDILNPDGSSLETGKDSKTIALGTIQCRAGIEIGL